MIAFGRRLSPAVFSIVIVLVSLCLLCVTSLVLHLAGVPGPAGALGRFLAEGFSWAGFFVPAYLLAGVALLLAPVFRRRSALLLMFSIVPFITLSLLFHVLSKSTSMLPQLLLDSFGMVPSALLLFLLLALETIFLFTLPYGAGTAASMRRAARAPLALPYMKRSDPLPVMTDQELDDLSSGAPTPLDLPRPPVSRLQPLKCSRCREMRALKICRSRRNRFSTRRVSAGTPSSSCLLKTLYRGAPGQRRPP